jgi:ribosomal protein L11 methyltransferase
MIPNISMSPPDFTARWTEPGSVWRALAVVHGADAASAVFGLLDGRADAVSAFEAAAGEWRVEAYCQLPLLDAELRVHLALAAAAADGALADLSEERLAARDWLVENQLSFPPLRVGRFFVYGSHYRGIVPAGAIGIAVDAAIAFGTGEHPSTRGCLLALEGLARRRRFRRPLDIGTGTGILSIAAAKLLRCRTLAGDIDPRAVSIARHNAVRNGVGGLIQARRAPGYRDQVIRKGRNDLIFANILARPLAMMAPALARRLAPGGRAVLSGLLRGQEPIVLAPHRGCGIFLDHRLVIEGWSTLVMRRPHASDMEMGAEAPICEFGSAARRVRPPLARRALRVSGTAPRVRTTLACGALRQGRRSATGEGRYRRASDRRAPSARHKPAAGAAIRKGAVPPT